nr:sex peptide receptor-like [Onthophagus taurus]
MDNITDITPINNITTPATFRYCRLDQFSNGYRELHGFLSILVCVPGSIANVLNIFILTSREMRSPTNFILTGLALADLMLMLEYVPYSVHVYFDPLNRKRISYFTYQAAVFMFFHALFSQICHFISCCLTLILAIWRYIAITYVQNTNIWCGPKRTMWAIALTYIFCPIICFPIFLNLTVVPKSRRAFENGTLVDDNIKMSFENCTLYNTTIYHLGYSQNVIYNKIMFWVYGVVLKLIPCILLTIFSHQLIKAVIAAKKRRYNLLSNKGIKLEKINGKAIVASNQRFLEKEQQTDRTTRMLLAVLLLFLIPEFPQAILGLVSGILDKFDEECHRPLGDLLDIFALTNSAINFILYCSMSSQFRAAFQKLLHSWRPQGENRKPNEKVLTTVTHV